MAVIVKQIAALETYPIRHPVLRQGRPFKDCAFKGDTNDDTIHLGLFKDETCVGVATFLNAENANLESHSQYQLRGMAVLEAQQGKGYGAKLLKRGEAVLKEKKIDLLWFNAREVAWKFYKQNGFKSLGKSFNIEGIGKHLVFYKKL